MLLLNFIFRLIKVTSFVSFDYSVGFLLSLRMKCLERNKYIEKYEYGFIFTSDIGDSVIFSTFLLVFLKYVSPTCVVVTSEVNIRLLKPLFVDIYFIGVDYSKYRNNLFYRSLKINELLKLSLDCCITPMRSRDYFLTDSIAMRMKKKKSVTFTSDNSNRNQYEAYMERFIYDEFLDGYDSLSHEILSYELLLKKFEVDLKSKIVDVVNVVRTNLQIKASPPKNIPKAYVVMNVGASMTYKRWPIGNYISLAQRIYQEYGFITLVMGGPAEKDLQVMVGRYPYIINLILKTDSFELIANLIINATLVVSNDSFIGHYAVFLGVPTLSIVGGGHFGRFLPYPKKNFSIYENSYIIFERLPCYNCNWTCSKIDSELNNSAFPCIGNITVTNVLKMVRNIVS
jgi:ADP-heptose:LPS heptosyltransferase